MGQTAKIQYRDTDTSPYRGSWRRYSNPHGHAALRSDWFWPRVSQQTDLPKVILENVKATESLPIDEAAFRKLASAWRRDTVMHSSLAKKVMHPAYQRIIGMGPSVLPLILREMKRKPGHWFWALDAITQGESPAQGCANLEEATKAWIRWGESKGYL